MSDSPKWSSYSLQWEQEEMLRRKREEEEALERARRAAEEERERRQRLEEFRTKISDQLAKLSGDLAGFTTTPTARFADRDQLQEKRQNLEVLQAELAKAGQLEVIQAIAKTAQGIERDFGQLRASAEASQLSANLAQEAAELVKLRRRWQAGDQQKVIKFDAPGREAVGALLDAADSLLKHKQLEQARGHIVQVRQRLEQHLALVADRLAAWTTARDEAVAVIGAAADRVAGLRGGETTMRWQPQGVSNIESMLAKARQELASEQFDSALREIEILNSQADQIDRMANEQQRTEERRQFVVNGMVQTLKDMGFVVQAGYPMLDDPVRPASDVKLEAVRLGGGAVLISVPQIGPILFDVDGFPMNAEMSSEGQTVTVCDEAEEQLKLVQDRLRDSFGILTGELMWHGKDPNRSEKKADYLGGGSEQRLMG